MAVDIRTWRDVRDREAVRLGVDAIFFETSARKTFDSEAERAGFRDRWIGRYLDRWPELAFVALSADGEPLGYLVGCLEDPAPSPFFADDPSFQNFRQETARFPAHLHVNVTEAARGEGVGGLLVARFVATAQAKGAPGLHVMTAEGMRNVGFYLGLGFHEAARLAQSGRTLLFLALSLRA